MPRPGRWTAQNELHSAGPSRTAPPPATREPGTAMATRAPAMASQVTTGEREESRCARGGRITAAAAPIAVEEISAIANRAGTDDQPTRKPATIANSAVPTVVTVRTFSTDREPTRIGSGSAADPAAHRLSPVRGQRGSAWRAVARSMSRRPGTLTASGANRPPTATPPGSGPYSSIPIDTMRGALAPGAGASANLTETIVRMGPVFSGRSGSGWRSKVWPGYTVRIALWCTSL